MGIRSKIINKGREIYYTLNAFWEFQNVLSQYFYLSNDKPNWNCLYWASAIRKHIQEVSALNRGSVYSMGTYGKIYYHIASYNEPYFGETHHIVVITKFEFYSLSEIMKGNSPTRIHLISIKPSNRFSVIKCLNGGYQIIERGDGRKSILKNDGLYLYYDDENENLSWFKQVKPITNGFAVSYNGKDISWVRFDGSKYTFANAKWTDYFKSNTNESHIISLSESDLKYIVTECVKRILPKSKVYKKRVVDNKGTRWPDYMSDQDIQILNNFLRKNKVTDVSQLLQTSLKCLERELYG